ncbi:MAG TPA: hypothetical protein VGD69_03340 [Herpetosiphonaceae bacterium]
MRLLVLWLCLVATIAPFAWLSPAAAAPHVAAPAPFPLTTEGHIGGTARVIKVVGQTGYLGEGNYLTILDLRTFPQIVVQSSLALDSRVEDIAIAGTMAYVALANTKIVIAAIGDPQHPVVLNSFAIGASGVVDDVEVVGSLLYVGSVQQGLQIFDVSNPHAPLLKGTYTASIGGPAVGRDLGLVGSVAYAISNSGGTTGVHVVDVSNPAAPSAIRVIPRVQANALTNALTISDGRLYVGESTGLHIYGLTTPTNPNLLGSYAGGAPDVLVANQRAYVAGGGLSIIDVSTPSSPQGLGGQSLRGYGIHAAVFGTTVLVAEGEYGLSAVDVSNPDAPQAIEHSYLGGEVWDMDVIGNMAYVGTINGLQIVDISDPKHPRIRSIFGKDVLGVKVVGDRAYISIFPRELGSEQFAGLQVVDVSDPDQPVLLGSFETQEALWRLTVVDTRIYQLFLGGFNILDASDPAAIQRITQVNINYLDDIVVEGDRLYVSGYYIVTTNLDGSEELSYGFAGSEQCYGTGIDAVGTTIYVAADLCGLQVLDLSDPYSEDHWREVARLPMRAGDVKIVGPVALVSDTAQGGTLTAVDISNPLQLTVRSRAAIPSRGMDLEVRGDRVFLAGSTNGMQIFDTPLSYTFLPLARQE